MLGIDDYTNHADLLPQPRAALQRVHQETLTQPLALVALVDRGERELPICPQFVGTSLGVPKGRMLRLDRDDDGRLALRLDA